MKHEYTAKVYFADGELLEQFGDHIDELIAWVYSQAETVGDDIHAEIIENKTHQVIKKIEFSPGE